MSWRVARSLDNLLDEVNTAAPNRSKASDGSIGDPAHAARVSDHNPNPAGVVRARDYTHDPAGGLDCNLLAAFLADLLGEHPALASGAYIIWNNQIISRDRIDEGWRPYSGSNPHTKHLHLSVATAASGYDSAAPWGWGTEGDDMSQYAEQLDRIEKKLTDLAVAEATRAKDQRKAIRQQAEAIRKRLRQDAVTVDDIATDVDTLIDMVADE